MGKAIPRQFPEYAKRPSLRAGSSFGRSCIGKSKDPGHMLCSGSSVLEATPGFEPGIEVLQTFALALGYVAVGHCRDLKKLAGVEGFEPPNDGIRIRCLTAWRYPCVVFCDILPQILPM